MPDLCEHCCDFLIVVRVVVRSNFCISVSALVANMSQVWQMCDLFLQPGLPRWAQLSFSLFCLFVSACSA